MNKPKTSRIVLTVKDISTLTGYSEGKSREDLKAWKKKLGLDDNDYFTVFHACAIFKISTEDLLTQLS